MDSTALDTDHKWFSARSTTDLNKHLAARGNLHLDPPQDSLTIDCRSFTNPISVIRSLTPSCLHLLVLPTASPAAPIAIFFRTKPNKGTAIHFQQIDLRLSICDPNANEAPPVGARGVIALSGAAETEWVTLVDHIDEKVLAAVGIPLGSTIAAAENSNLVECVPRFMPLPRLRPSNATRAELTAYHIDRTAYIKALVGQRYYGDMNRMLGEMQLAFVCFMYLGCLHAAEHWTLLLRELCNAGSLSSVFPGAVDSLAKILNSQFSAMDIETVRFALKDELRKCLACFVSAGWQRKPVQQLTKTLNRIMQWTLTGHEEDGDDSDGPVVVAL